MFRNKFLQKITILVIIVAFLCAGLIQVIGLFSAKRDVIVSVGKYDITARDFHKELSKEIEYINKYFKINVDNEYLYNSGIREYVIDRLIYERVLDSIADDLKVDYSNEFVIEKIKGLDVFQDGGHFSRDKLLEVLSENDMTESDYFNLIKSQMRRSMITIPLLDNYFMFSNVINNILMYDLQRRLLKVFSISLSEDIDIINPTDNMIESYYNDNRNKFISNELRSIRYVQFDDSLIQEINVTVTDIEAQIKLFNIAETYDYNYVVFESLEQAEDIALKLQSGTVEWNDFRGLPSYQESFHVIKNFVTEGVIYNALNDTNEGRVLILSDGSGDKYYVFHLSTIHVLDEIEMNLLRKKVATILSDMRRQEKLGEYLDNVEWLINKDQSFDDILDSIGIEDSAVFRMENFDIYGNGLDGLELDKSVALLLKNHAFSAEKGKVLLADDKKNHYYLIEVFDIRPPVLQPLHKVVDTVRLSLINYAKDDKYRAILRDYLDNDVNYHTDIFFRDYIYFLINGRSVKDPEYVKQTFELDIGKSTDIFEIDGSLVVAKLVDVLFDDYASIPEDVKMDITADFYKVIKQILFNEFNSYLRNYEINIKRYDNNILN
ncbi:MAG: hypothetical protein P857_64 [Candidatus Xenolissoclinum pacificiensis L6]|uniref:Uncharacterized protein n=1 Tax=Candidatus Xenolissoclinum pacificiensis L6 TaxID=1401685 RepID=W2UZT3_9RICK|nr:MAG: hypothetical protein P857_64 [Candidatus Xenolissoclinum pacificiensis L6]